MISNGYFFPTQRVFICPLVLCVSLCMCVHVGGEYMCIIDSCKLYVEIYLHLCHVTRMLARMLLLLMHSV